MESTNSLLRELIEELRHNRQTDKATKKGQSQDYSHRAKEGLAASGPRPLPGLTPPPMSSDGESDDGGEKGKPELTADHPLEQVKRIPLSLTLSLVDICNISPMVLSERLLFGNK